MNHPHPDLEAELTRLLEQQLEEYAETGRLLDRHAAALGRSSLSEVDAGALQAALIRAKQTETKVAEQRTAWQATGARPGPRLQAILNQQQKLLESLIARTAEAESAAQGHRERMAPRLDAASRGREMQTAYARGAGRE